MNDLIDKYSIIKREDLKILRWCAVNQSDFHDANRFMTKKSAVKWARKRQRTRPFVKSLESYVLLEDGTVQPLEEPHDAKP